MKTLLEDRRLLLPVLLTAVAIAVAAGLIIVLADNSSGSGSAAAPSSSSASGGAGTTKVDITDYKFKPASITVKAGAKVSWVNHDSAPHTATAGQDFDTGTLKKGDTKAVTLDKPGSYSYECQFHAFMKGTVVVK